MTIRLVGTAIAALAFAAAAPAAAVPLAFDFSGPSGTATFELDSMPTPDFAGSLFGSDQFGFYNVAGTFGGVRGVATVVSFGSGSIFSAFSITAPGLGFSQFTAPTLFTGPPTAPILAPGSFTLINPFFGNAALTISVAPIPEPATWALLLAGFAVTGVAARRTRAAPRPGSARGRRRPQ